MGGSGKTTLAKEVYNDESIRLHFDGSLSLQMDLMSSDESWNLFGSIAFSNEVLPSEFKIIGKQIVDKCHGLPLTIVMVAGLLKSKRTIEYWENVAKDFGIFPEDNEILVKRLVRLWMAEGFLKLENDLAGEAEKCLQELVDRCLVLVSKRSLDETKIRSCKVHDPVHDLCLRELTQSQDVFVLNDILPYEMCSDEAQSSNPVPLEYCRLSRHEIWPFKQRTGYWLGHYRVLLNPGYHHHLIRGQTTDDSNNLLKRTRSIFSMFSFYLDFPLESQLFHFGSLRILDLTGVTFGTFPTEILYLVWLRYLSMSGYFHVPPTICNLFNLQTFIAKSEWTPTFPQQIWGLLELRHLVTDSIDLKNPSSLLVNEERSFVFSNIHTISGMYPRCCTEEVMSGIVNVKKLGIYGNEEDYVCFQESRFFNNLFHLHQLETLSLKLHGYLNQNKNSPLTIPSAKVFPATLKKLKLINTGLSWGDLNIIGELRNLEAQEQRRLMMQDGMVKKTLVANHKTQSKAQNYEVEAQVTKEEEEEVHLFVATSSTKKSDLWMIDSGCTNHMTYAKTLFKQFLPLKNKKVRIENGDYIAEVKGNVAINTISVDMSGKSFLFNSIEDAHKLCKNKDELTDLFKRSNSAEAETISDPRRNVENISQK
ncbi:putative WD repeat-containing protein 43-like [Capsicum annuum]|nr:putative WD repeat-containing protein 43-like [Capsicum annuum]